jgi:phage shock protein PspC (stress-responsive transcriptional regulator)
MRLTRSRDDVVVAGVLAGLGDYFKIDPTLIRIGAAILIFFSPFPVIPLYIIGAIIIPKAPKNREKDARRSRRDSKRSNRRMNRDRNFEERDDNYQNNERSSSKVNDIKEEDWSDF